MRKYNKALTALLSLLMMVVLSIGMASCTTIEVLMGLFQDSSISGPSGGGIFPSTHTCESVCPECGLCTDLTCQENICTDKCQGHEEVHECESECPECGKCLDMTCEEEACKDKCGEVSEYQTYVFEAEDSHNKLKGGVHGDLMVSSQPEYTTETYIGNFFANAGAYIEFSINAEETTTATLFVSACKRTMPLLFTNIVAVTVNRVNMLDVPSIIPASETDNYWGNWYEVNLGCIQLNQGKNIVKLAVMDTSDGFNINNISLKSSVTLSWFEGPHACEFVCSTCGKCTNYECNESACYEKCEENWAGNYTFSAIDSRNEVVNGTVDTEKNAMLYTGATTTYFAVQAPEKTYAGLYATVSKNATDLKVSDLFDIKYNANVLKSTATIPASEEEGFITVNLGYIELVPGKNVVMLKGKGELPEGFCVKDIVIHTKETMVEWYTMPTAANYIFEAENAASNAWAVNEFWKMEDTVASGRGYVGHLIAGEGYYFLFSIYAEEDCEATLYLGLGTSATMNLLSMPVTINDGEPISVDRGVPANGWTSFADVEIGVVSLKKGNNTLRIDVNAGANTNIDYIGFACDTVLSSGEEIKVHQCESICDLCGKCLDIACMEDACVEKCQGHGEIVMYKFEAENADSNAWEVNEFWKMSNESASGGTFVGHLTGGKGYYLSFTVIAEEACEATLYYGLGAGGEFNLDKLPLQVNGVDISLDKKITASGWETFISVEVTKISLVKGENTIVIMVNAGAATNIDYIGIASTIEMSEPEKEPEIPDTPVETTKTKYKFEAEKAGGEHNFWELSNDGASGGKYLGNIASGQGYYLSFEIYAKEACEATLYLGLGAAGEMNASVLPIKVNGVAVASDKTIAASGWEVFVEVEIVNVTLVAGRNVITVGFETGAATNIDYMTLESATELSATAFETEPVEPTEKTYTFEAENAASNAWAVNEFWKLTSANASGGSYIGHLTAGSNYYLSFTVVAEDACEAMLYYGLGVGAEFNANALALTLNGTQIALDGTLAANGWEAFTQYEIATVNLVKGDNTIVIMVNAGVAANFDYIALKTEKVLSEGTHTLLPEEEPEEPDTPVETTKTKYKFEAEKAGGEHNFWELANAGASGGKYMGNIASGQGYYLSFEIYAKEACEATLYLGLGAAGEMNASVLPIKVNGVAVASDKTIAASGWEVFVEVEIVNVTLVKGKNVITVGFEAGAATNIDYMTLESATLLSATEIAA